MPEVLPGPEVLPDDAPVVLRESEPAQAPTRPPVTLTLDRLLDRAKPSLAEAALLSALVLEALADLHDSGAALGGVDTKTVRLTTDGRVDLTGPRPAPKDEDGPNRDDRRADVRAAAGIVEAIDKAAGRPVRALTDREERLVARLTAAADARSLSRRGPRRAGRGLEMAIGPCDQREAARERLTGLVRAVAGYDAISTVRAARTAGPLGAAGPRNGGGSPLARKLPPPARRPPLWPRLWKPLAIVAAVLIIFGAEVTFFGDKVKRNVDTLLTHEAQAADGPKKPAALPDLGPPTAGPINHLDLRPLDGCRPEAMCNAVVQVAVAAQPAPMDVAWNFELFDRCGTLHETRPGGVMSIPAGGERAVQTVAVALPAGKSLALVPVATAPVRVAGSPMPLSPSDRPC
jgi:hypothetical protein